MRWYPFVLLRCKQVAWLTFSISIQAYSVYQVPGEHTEKLVRRCTIII